MSTVPETGSSQQHDDWIVAVFDQAPVTLMLMVETEGKDVNAIRADELAAYLAKRHPSLGTEVDADTVAEMGEHVARACTELWRKSEAGNGWRVVYLPEGRTFVAINSTMVPIHERPTQ